MTDGISNCWCFQAYCTSFSIVFTLHGIDQSKNHKQHNQNMLNALSLHMDNNGTIRIRLKHFSLPAPQTVANRRSDYCLHQHVGDCYRQALTTFHNHFCRCKNIYILISLFYIDIYQSMTSQIEFVYLLEHKQVNMAKMATQMCKNRQNKHTQKY